jgi:organic radical activating enzyme
MCDTDYTSNRRMRSVLDTVVEVHHVNRKASLVVITGGEPFRQNIAPLVRALLYKGFAVQIESNGTLYREGFPYEDVTIVVSPKTGYLNKKLLPYISAYKYVVRAPGNLGGLIFSDGLPYSALGHPVGSSGVARPHNKTVPVYIQPCDEKDETRNAENTLAAVGICLEHGHTLAIQIHKLVGLE